MGPHFQTVLTVVNQLLSELSLEHEVALYSLGEQVKRHISFTRDIAGSRPIKLESPAGGTPLYSGLADVSKEFSPPRFGDTILLISDAIDTMAPQNKNKFEEVLSQRGVRVVILPLTPGSFFRARFPRGFP
jgi:hypothetical protein